MSERPMLSTELECGKFLEYYYLKEELTGFCRENGISTAGGKQDITKRVAHFLKTGERLSASVKKTNHAGNADELTLDSIIDNNFVCSEKHRQFFESVIGSGFSFNVVFQKYLKANAEKTYSDAVNAWYKIREDKKNNKGTSKIESQFEYNTYIRDFFNDNKDRPLKEAVKCWKYKKSQAGHNRYERQDLRAIGM